MKKKSLRKKYISKRSSLSNHEWIDRSIAIKDIFFGRFDLGLLRRIHLFISMEEDGEVRTSFIFNELWRNYPLAKTVSPRVNGDILEHLLVDRNTRFESSRWGISEPTGDSLLEPKEMDLVVVPLLCFDKRGHRVGYGKGYYDKFLAKCRDDCLKVGVSFFYPIDEISDINQHDVMLDFCITPESVWTFRS